MLRDLSIRGKLFLLTCTAVLIAVALIGVVVIRNNTALMTDAKLREVCALAEVLGTNTVAAMERNDRKLAESILASLASQPALDVAVLYDKSGHVFAAYPAKLFAHQRPPAKPPHSGEVIFQLDRVEVTRRVSYPNDFATPANAVGTIWMRANLNGLRVQRASHIAAIAEVLLLALASALVVSTVVQRLITAPIEQLVDAAQQIAMEQDTSLRVHKLGTDELGTLCDSFNYMLDQLADGRRELLAAHDRLEQRVTERTAELQVALEQAQASNKAKSDFLANMSHEIRTPMTAVLGYAELLEEESLTPEGRERISTIVRNGQHLLTIINDILDVSKIESGQFTVERIDCSTDELVADTVSLWRRKAAEKDLFLEVTYRGLIPARIQTDPTRLRQILTNLIGNAIKFTERGGIQLVIGIGPSRDVGPDRHVVMQFDVIDTGIGMPPGQMERIFRPFTQADETMTRRFGGTGLGLTISRHLARQLGGDITVQSRNGAGSSFTLTIDVGSLNGVAMIADCRELMQPDMRSRPTAGKELQRLAGRILVVEDGIDNQRLIRFLLEKAGASVMVAANGQEGRDAALRAWHTGQPFDVIFMDMQMPVLDGYTATRQLRDAEYPRPIIALTAHAMSHERDRCLAAGCNDFINKPIDRVQLLSLAARWSASSIVEPSPNARLVNS